MDKQSRKQQILRSACALFAQQGYDATSVAQIAKQCGCSSSLVIRHFGSKENVYNALLEELREACKQPLISVIPEGGTMEQLESLYNTLIYDVVSPADDQSELLSALQSRSGTDEARAEAMRYMQDVGIDVFLPILQEGVANGTFPSDFPCETAARTLWLHINGTRIIHKNYPKMPVLPFSDVRRLLLEHE